MDKLIVFERGDLLFIINFHPTNLISLIISNHEYRVTNITELEPDGQATTVLFLIQIGTYTVASIALSQLTRSFSLSFVNIGKIVKTAFNFTSLTVQQSFYALRKIQKSTASILMDVEPRTLSVQKPFKKDQRTFMCENKYCDHEHEQGIPHTTSRTSSYMLLYT